MVDDEELLELVEMEVELLSFYEYDGDNAPVVSGYTSVHLMVKQWADTVMKLMESVDSYIPKQFVITLKTF